ncbi:hypothetical protein D3C86_1798860 [compost metagenome]
MFLRLIGQSLPNSEGWVARWQNGLLATGAALPPLYAIGAGGQRALPVSHYVPRRQTVRVWSASPNQVRTRSEPVVP